MKKLLLLLLICAFNATAAIEYHCYEYTTADTEWTDYESEEIDCDANNLIGVDITAFDSSLSDSTLESNWYYLTKYTDDDKVYFNFWEDEVWNLDSLPYELKYRGFYGKDSGIWNDEDLGEVYYGEYNVDVTYSSTDSSFEYKEENSSLIKMYAFEDDTDIVLSGDSSAGYVVSNGGDKLLSSIQFGSANNFCQYSMSSSYEFNDDGSYSSDSIFSFSSCEITVTAANNDDGSIYYYTASFDGVSIDLSTVNSYDDLDATAELYNSNGQLIGYLSYNFCLATYSIVDLNGDPFEES